MILPLRSDAPLYHYPWVTIGLVVVNVAAFFATGMGDADSAREWILVYGEGLHPRQWLTSNFMHAGFLHLAGNMLFLICFGLVVEGKIGWWKYLAIYLALGVVQGAIEQSLSFWFAEGASLGASGIICGLMAISLVWAPENEIEMLGVWGFYGPMRSTTFDVSILSLAGYYIALDVLSAALAGFRPSTGLLHLLGAALGFGIGVLMLKKGWVDCENWDLFAVLQGRGGKSAAEARLSPPPVRRVAHDLDVEPPSDPEPGPEIPPQEKALGRLRVHLRDGRETAALSLYNKTVQYAGRWELPEEELARFIDLLCEKNLRADAVPFLEEFIRRFPAKSDPARLKLAGILIREQKRPQQALRVLAGIPKKALPAQHEARRASLLHDARQLIDDGILEPESRAV